MFISSLLEVNYSIGGLSKTILLSLTFLCLHFPPHLYFPQMLQGGKFNNSFLLTFARGYIKMRAQDKF